MIGLRDPGIKAIISPFRAADIPWEGGRRLYRWWRAARNGRPFPSRADFTPRLMAPFLSTMVLHNVEPGAHPDYRLRLAGTEFHRWLGRDPTGLALDDLPNTAPLRARYDWIREHRIPYLCLNLPLDWSEKPFMTYSTLVLPLGEDPGRVDMLIANLHFHAPS